MKKITLLAAALMGIALGIWCQGCAEITVPCIPGQTVVGATGGQDLSTIQTALGGLVSLATTAGILAAKPRATAPTTSNGTVTVKTSTLLGPASGTCTEAPATSSS